MTAPNVVAKWSAWAPRLLSVLRIFTAFAGPWSLDAKRGK